MATQSNYTILVDAQIQNLQNIQKQLNDLHSQINVNVNAQGLSETTRQTQSLAQASDNANTAAGELILTYQVANQIFHASVEAIGSMVEQVYELDSAITEFKKVSDLQGQSLSKYVDNLSQMGLQVARTGSEMVMAAGQFRKSGFNDKDAAMLASVAAQFQNIADTSVSAEDAASSIVSQIRAFGWGAEEATHIIDAYNEVANNFSVGTNDLSKALELSAAGMAVYGNSFEEVIGLVTAGTEIMQGRSSQIARGLNTISANIVANKDLLKQYGIEVEDSNGNLMSTFDVLKALKPQWDNMTDAERNAVGVALAG
ncbi:MAG: phage tail tape measure protein [Clostridia bacterium]|nr:phage tail tape measure protein [Clostridia bacterium]